MKNIFKTLLFAGLTATFMASCVSDDDTAIPPYTAPLLSQNFASVTDGVVFNDSTWVNYAQAGTAKWTGQVYSGDGYVEFNPYGSGNASNIGWLVSPKFTLATGNTKHLSFDASESFVTDFDHNTIEVFISDDFDGTNVTAATWQPLTANLPVAGLDNFQYVWSNPIDLSAFSGDYYIAFKVTGSGTNTSLDGAYQLDNITIY